MGNFRSWNDDRSAARRSAQIDRQIKQDGKRLGDNCRLLLIGMSALSLGSPALTLIARLGWVWQVHNRQADSHRPPRWLLSRRKNSVPQGHIFQPSRERTGDRRRPV